MPTLEAKTEINMGKKAIYKLKHPGTLELLWVGKNKKAIEEYIRNQLVEDEMMDQMTMKEYTDPFTGGKNDKA